MVVDLGGVVKFVKQRGARGVPNVGEYHLEGAFYGKVVEICETVII